MKTNPRESSILKFAIPFLVFAAAIICLAIPRAEANVLEFATSNTTATSTIAYMTPGTATTTYSVDSFLGAESNAMDKLALLVQFTASSTLTTLNWRTECSMDNIDWYQCELISGTTTAQTLIFPPSPTTYSWNFASSTPAGGAIGTIATSSVRIMRVFTVVPATRYSRVSFFLPIGSGNGGVWATFIGQKQTPQ